MMNLICWTINKMKTTTKHCQKCKTTSEPLAVNSRSKRGTFSYMCRKCNTERHKRYRSTEEGKKITYRAIYKSIENNFYKQLARYKLNTEVRKGNILKPIICSVCKQTKKIEGHHPDYTKPLDVIWCCRSCHADLDRVVDKSF